MHSAIPWSSDGPKHSTSRVQRAWTISIFVVLIGANVTRLYTISDLCLIPHMPFTRPEPFESAVEGPEAVKCRRSKRKLPEQQLYIHPSHRQRRAARTATAGATCEQPKYFRIFSLPLELREMIYKHLDGIIQCPRLCKNSRNANRNIYTMDQDDKARKQSHVTLFYAFSLPTFARVNNQAREEITYLFLRLNTFAVEFQACSWRFWKTFGKFRLGQLEEPCACTKAYRARIRRSSELQRTRPHERLCEDIRREYARKLHSDMINEIHYSYLFIRLSRDGRSLNLATSTKLDQLEVDMINRVANNIVPSKVGVKQRIRPQDLWKFICLFKSWDRYLRDESGPAQRNYREPFPLNPS
ncbi:hypothetical protein EJ05DRAFT_174362 [Pseudovirgaria hyperparasitica]|uniref:Uncharacterized protein n=1 Tax=Pseudovirgaria hyperparasitica TaxID=470096 RepID=A0A6A6WHG0_9PEZI|nr:uncharacterized protein EJ05DRAFT_174362 [Pseudovirgaria hyperparasitica]KAF2761510.1 hypothetical protein EJ05DRAFT_174362 [Pseudovirgaria hyperparasitica]